MKSDETPTPTGEQPLVVFVHIRKTAGLTMRRIIQRQYRRRSTRHIRNYFVEPDRSLEMARTIALEPPEGVRALHGHMLFWPDLPWAAGTRFFAFLRDPVERTISHYYWMRERSPKFEATLENALVDGLIHDNLQTRVIAGSMPFVANEETLEQALANLDRLTAIGLTDRFDESVVLLTRQFGWRPMAYSTQNVTAGRPPRDEFTAETLAVIERYNAFDLELFRAATARLERALAEQDDDFAVDVAALRRANACLAEAPDTAKLDRLTVDGAGGAGDVREQLVAARAAILLRDAEIERLRAGAGEAPARPARKPLPSVATRAGALEAAAGRAKRRIERMTQKIEALEQQGAPTGSPEIETLRRGLERAQTRLDGFERRLAKLGEPETKIPAG